MSEWNCCWQTVTCADCDRTYQCTPNDDYYNSTDATDGVCFRCLLARNNMTGARVMTVLEPSRSPSTPPPPSTIGPDIGAAATASTAPLLGPHKREGACER